jgi:acetolactate synthase-1/2/3 large subunit
VHLDVPENLMNGPCGEVPIQKPSQYRRVEPLNPPRKQVREAAKMLATASLPIIHTGSGVIHSQAFDELKSVAEILHSPVTTSWSSRSALPETSELAWPMVHIKAVNQLRNEADLVLVLGSELGETDWWAKRPYWGSPADQKFIQVDIDEEKLGRNRPVELAIMGDVKVFLGALLEELEAIKDQIPISKRKEKVSKLREEITKDRAKLDEKLQDNSSPMITAHVGRICREECEDDAVVVFDGGNTAVWGNFFFEMRHPNTQLGTHHMGHLGAGIGQALGAKVARPDKKVICIIGDGAMGFNPQEIETAVRNNLDVVFIVCCDKQWGMVKMTQCFTFKPFKTMIKKTLSPDEVINTELGEIEFDKLAQSMGAQGERVASPDDFRAALKKSLDSGKCSVIHVDVDPTKHMWAPGLMHFKDMHQEPKGK